MASYPLRYSDFTHAGRKDTIHLLRPAKGPLGVHDPAFLVQALAAATGGAVVGFVVQFAVAQTLLEARHELAAKEGAQDMDRE